MLEKIFVFGDFLTVDYLESARFKETRSIVPGRWVNQKRY